MVALVLLGFFLNILTVYQRLLQHLFQLGTLRLTWCTTRSGFDVLCSEELLSKHLAKNRYVPSTCVVRTLGDTFQVTLPVTEDSLDAVTTPLKYDVKSSPFGGANLSLNRMGVGPFLFRYGTLRVRRSFTTESHINNAI